MLEAQKHAGIMPEAFQKHATTISEALGLSKYLQKHDIVALVLYISKNITQTKIAINRLISGKSIRQTNRR